MAATQRGAAYRHAELQAGQGGDEGMQAPRGQNAVVRRAVADRLAADRNSVVEDFPAALPNIFVGLRISAGLAVIGAVVGDFYFRQGGTVGIGAQIDVYRSRLWGAELITAIIMASVLGLVVFLFFGWLSRRAIGKWHITTRGQ